MILIFPPALQLFDFKGPLESLQLILILFLFVIYFLPCGIAGARKAKGGCLVFFVNLLLGWTIIGWFAALILAFGGRKKSGDV